MTLTTIKTRMGKAFARHFIIWVIWQSINSLRLIPIWHEVPKLPLLYNYISLVILFYPVYFCARGYWKSVTYQHLQGLTKWQRLLYLFFRWRVILITFFILTYVIGSWFVDRYVFHIIYDNFPLYCDGRWTRASTYVFIAVGYSYIKYLHAQYTMKLEAADIKIIILQDYIARNHVENKEAIQELTRRVDEYTRRKTG